MPKSIFEPEGREFESLRARHSNQYLTFCFFHPQNRVHHAAGTDDDPPPRRVWRDPAAPGGVDILPGKSVFRSRSVNSISGVPPAAQIESSGGVDDAGKRHPGEKLRRPRTCGNPLYRNEVAPHKSSNESFAGERGISCETEAFGSL